MMTENEHVLLCLSEECDEVGQRTMKALRFGLDEQQEGYLPNRYRLVEEIQDLISVVALLVQRGVLPKDTFPSVDIIKRKEQKIMRNMEIARREGVLE